MSKHNARHIECTIEEYHARLEWGRSQLSKGKESWPLFAGLYVTKEFADDDRTPAKDIGTVTHAAALGGAWSTFRILPKTALSSSGSRAGAAYKRWLTAHPGKIDVKRDDYDGIRHMLRNLHADRAAHRILTKAKYMEYTIVWQDEETGLWLRARPDIITPAKGGVIVGDLKTDRSVTAAEFAWHMGKYGYHRQAAWYWDACEAIGMDVIGFVFLVVNKTPAHECFVRNLKPRAIERGREENRKLLRELARRLRDNDWASPSHGVIEDIDLPAPFYKEDLDE
jgi:hypothetical protein